MVGPGVQEDGILRLDHLERRVSASATGMFPGSVAAWQQWLFKTNEGPELVERALFHETQHYTAQYLEDLAQRIRTARTAEDCFLLQKDLLGLLFRVEQIEDGATQLLRTSGPDLDIRAKQFAGGRGARQLRTIGDALAWMVFGGDRRAVIALSQNEQPGRIHGKGERGLKAEMNAVNAFWHRDGHFALLHDLTNLDFSVTTCRASIRLASGRAQPLGWMRGVE